MDPRDSVVYLGEIAKQCRFALNAIGALNNVLPRLTSDGLTDHDARNTLHEEVFRTLHSFLTHASNLSRLLWPPKPQKKRAESTEQYAARKAATADRGRVLRDMLGLPSDHSLRSRTLRDHLDHFDERLDDWRRESVAKSYVQDFIGPKGSIEGIDDRDMMRWYDQYAKMVRFRGEEYDIQAMVQAIGEVRVRAEHALDERDPGRRPIPGDLVVRRSVRSST